MQIQLRDLTPAYLQYALRQREQAYFATYPELFQHYYRYWAAPGELVHLPENVVQEKVRLIKTRLPRLKQAFTRQGFSDTIWVVLFVGANTSNGHAFWDENRQSFVVWLPVEAYASPLQVDVFATHEIIHALHYTRRPEFYFQDEKVQHRVGRQVITEGIATWGTQVLTGYDETTVLWADYVSASFAKHWYEQCRSQLPAMAQRILDEWNDSQEANPWFSMWDEKDVTRYRGGYYVGLQVIEKTCEVHGINLPALLALEMRIIEKLAMKRLKEMVME